MDNSIFDSVINRIRIRSREGWVAFASSQYARGRDWVQENAELGALAGFGAGVVIVLFFSIAFWAFILAGFVAAVVWLIALPESGMGDISKPVVPASEDPAAAVDNPIDKS